MLKAKLFFTRRRGVDDIVEFYDDEIYPQMVRIVYTPGEYTDKSHEFHLTIAGVYEYLHNMLASMENDNDPFEYIQVSTAIHPSVMIPVCDISCSRTRARVEDMVEQALRASIDEIKLKRNVRSPVFSR